MLKKVPLLLMFVVLGFPFLLSVIFLSGDKSIANTAQGEWLSETIHAPTIEAAQWHILWRRKDCLDQCEQFQNLLSRVKMALGKHQEKLYIVETLEAPLQAHDKGLFISNREGLVLLAYTPNDDGAYKLLKDLKVLIKHGGA